jgi:hypothetical protein
LIGSGVGFMIVNILSLYSDEYYSQFLIELAILGFFTSLGQWIFLCTKLHLAWLWMPATTVGFILGYDAYKFILPIYEIYILIYPISIGLFVGLFQILVIRKDMKASLGWIVVSVMSWDIAYKIVLSLIHMSTIGFPMGAITGLFIGTVSGLFLDLIRIKPEKIELLIPQGEAS